LALFRRQTGRDHFAAAVKLRRDDVCAKLQTQADERLHHGHGAMRAVA